MAECVYCGEEIAEDAEKCPSCNQMVDLEPGSASPFARRYKSCCRTRLSLTGLLAGMVIFTAWLYFYWLPAGAGPGQMAAILLPGLFVGAILGVYAAAAFAMLIATIGGSSHDESEESSGTA